MLDWREEGRLLIGQEARGVQEVVERELPNKEKDGRPIPNSKWHRKFGVCHATAGMGTNFTSRRGRECSEKRQDVSRRQLDTQEQKQDQS